MHAEQCILVVWSPENQAQSDTRHHLGGASAEYDHHHSCCVLEKVKNQKIKVKKSERARE